MAPTAPPRVHYPEIERRPGLSARDFEREYLAENRPVVIPLDCAPWLEQWSMERLRAEHGDASVDAEDPREVYVGDRAYAKVSLGELLDAARANDTTRRWKGLDFLSTVPGMRARLEASPAPFSPLLPPGAHARLSTLWIAPGRTMSSFHHDGNADNLNLQVSGKKIFLLAPPSSHRAVYRHDTAESPINPFTPDLARFPRFAAARPLETTLSAGDVLLVPKFWWHAVYALEPSVNLATFFSWHGEVSAWRAQAGVPLAHRALATLSAELRGAGRNEIADACRNVYLAARRRLVPRVDAQPRGALHAESVEAPLEG